MSTLKLTDYIWLFLIIAPVIYCFWGVSEDRDY